MTLDQNNGKPWNILAGVVAMISVMVAVVRPMQQQIESLTRQNTELETRLLSQIKAQDDKIKTEISRAEASSKDKYEMNKTRVERLEEWQTWWYRTVAPIDTEQNRRIDNLEKKQ